MEQKKSRETIEKTPDLRKTKSQEFKDPYAFSRQRRYSEVQRKTEKEIVYCVEEFCEKKSIIPFTKEEIQQKNDYFDSHYTVSEEKQDERSRYFDNDSSEVQSTKEETQHNTTSKGIQTEVSRYAARNHPEAQVVINVKRVDNSDYHINAINLKDRSIEGYDNEIGYYDTGKQNMHLSDIHYQTLRIGLEKAIRDGHSSLEPGLTIDTFQPRLIYSNGIAHEATKDIIGDIIEDHEKKFPYQKEDTTDENKPTHIFFPRGSREFKTIMTETVLGQSKNYLLENYFPGSYCNGVEIAYSRAQSGYLHVHGMVYEIQNTKEKLMSSTILKDANENKDGISRKEDSRNFDVMRQIVISDRQ